MRILDVIAEIIARYYVQLFLTLASGVVVHLWNRIKLQNIRYDALQEGVKSLLRSEIINSFMRVKIRSNGYMDIHERDNIQELYDAYKLLNGNGTIDDLMVEIRKFPIRRED